MLLTLAIGAPIYMLGRRGIGALVGVRVGHERGDEPHRARALTIAAGPAANYLVAMLLFLVVGLARGVAGPPNRIEVTDVVEGMPADVAGLRIGDHLVAVGGLVVDPSRGTAPTIEVLREHAGEPIEVVVSRDRETHALMIEPTAEGKVGVGLAPLGDRVSLTVGEAASRAVETPLRITRSQLVGLYQLVTGQLTAEVQGPVRLSKTMEASSRDESAWIKVLQVVAFTSTMFGTLMLLPLPGCAGGRMILLLYEAARRRRLGPQREAKIHRFGVVALLVIIAIVTLVDVCSFSLER